MVHLLGASIQLELILEKKIKDCVGSAVVSQLPQPVCGQCVGVGLSVCNLGSVSELLLLRHCPKGAPEGCCSAGGGRRVLLAAFSCQ